MRIKRHDVPATVYTSTETIDSEGISKAVWASLHTANADWQPTSGRTKLEAYGLDTAPAGTMMVYCDLETDFPVNSVAVRGGKNYQCVGMQAWYDHCEVLMVPWKGSLT